MKARELAEKLMENPEFTVTATVNEGYVNNWPQYRKFAVDDIADIGYSDMVIVLSLGERGGSHE